MTEPRRRRTVMRPRSTGAGWWQTPPEDKPKRKSEPKPEPADDKPKRRRGKARDKDDQR